MIKNLSVRHKILLLCILPVLLVSSVLMALFIVQSQVLGKKNIEEFSQQIMSLRKKELKNYLDLATHALHHAYDNQNLDQEYAQTMAKAILRDLSYGKDGYFFVYDYDGRNLMHPKKPYLEGKSLWNLQDEKGVYWLREMIAAAKTGSNKYTRYIWDRPSTGKASEKLSFSVGLERWQWMIGTGLYVDDLEQATKRAQELVVSNTRQMIWLTLSISLLFTVIVTCIAIRFTVSQGRLANTKLQRLSKNAVRERGQEQVEVARLIHENVIKRLSLVVRGLVKYNQSLQSDKNSEKGDVSHSHRSQKMLKGIIDIVLSAKEQALNIADDLHPSVLIKEGVFVAIEEFANTLSEKSHIKIKVSVVNATDRPPAYIETIAYRIVREAMENVFLHSQATEASIRLRQTRHVLSMTIQDNGVGFDPDTAAINSNERGIGLSDMKMKAELLHGTFTLFSSEGTGTMIKVSLPLSIS